MRHILPPGFTTEKLLGTLKKAGHELPTYDRSRALAEEEVKPAGLGWAVTQ